MKNRNDKIISTILGSLALPIVLLCILILLTFLFSAYESVTFNLEILRDPEYQRMFLNILKNTFLITVISLVISSSFAYFAAFNISFIQEGKTRSLLLSLIRILSSFPSVLLGLLVASVFVHTSNPGSFILYGSLVLAILIGPFLCLNFCNDMLSVPRNLLVSSDALGMKSFQQLRYIIHPYIRRKLISSILLAFCRCIGEATAMFIICNAIFMAGGNDQFTFASYILDSFSEGFPGDSTWQLVVLITSIFTVVYYLLYFLQQKIRRDEL